MHFCQKCDIINYQRVAYGVSPVESTRFLIGRKIMGADLSNTVVTNLNVNNIKDYVTQFINKDVVITRIEKSKANALRCKIISLSTNIFMVQIHIGKDKLISKSFMYNDLLANKISIQEDIN